MRALPDIRDAGDLKGKRVLLRTDFDVLIDTKKKIVLDDLRIQTSLATINYLREQEAKIIIVSHAGRPKGKVVETMRLAPVASRLAELLKTQVPCAADVTGVSAEEIVSSVELGGVVMLENVRFEEGELENGSELAKALAKFGDLYVNDAFADSHRKHASIVGIPKLLPHYAGIQFLKEVEGLSKALEPEHPALALLSGAKFETKSPLIRKFLKTYDTVFVGGALANDFFKAQGYEVGRSVISDEVAGIEDLLLEQKLLLPADVIVETTDGTREEREPRLVGNNEIIFDAGKETVAVLKEKIADAKFILWNGPFGVYEKGFTESTEEVARMIAQSDAVSVVGGGDTIAAIAKLKLEDKFTFLSTAGGAMLEFLAKGTLPGIDALRS